MSRTWNTRIEQDVHLPLESYSPWSPCIINYGLKSRNEMRDHSIYILYSLSSKYVKELYVSQVLGQS